MRFIKSLIQKMLGTTPVPTNGGKPTVVAALPQQAQHLAVMQGPQPPVQLPLDEFPQTLADAIAYVRMGEPKANPSGQITWHDTCAQLRKQYKAHTLNALHAQLKKISTGSLKDTEEAIDIALLNLRMLAPVKWMLGRDYVENHSDGSRSFRLIAHYAVINPNGAFAITDLDHVIWLHQPSASGTAFVSPHK
ncbi:hypothetical protein DEE44_11410 [Ralstonia pickettii]|jgi:hypothetical protein|uniref:Uncharacterized protein n=2 Tax=Ralstonia pickettii TaxID=329 RepID=A0ABM9IPB4_RALPI|nr:hypothetical protein [Ralstonia pickettii]MBA9882664.1 hypothetical protein [Ralstonia pickettii]MBA9892780.1 hypothetical protein [Ralstonia pickettii]MBA9924523.1 hypothetical protein [Ralstonia pickettii]MBA9963889.1 hypothetical protein [Ralstonia pickettii]MBB0177549.1 hypothetical protein [Ralstonia pickettii]